MSTKKYSSTKRQQSQQARNYPAKYWNNPIGKIAIVVIGGVIVYLIGLLISHVIPPRENKNKLEIPRSPNSGAVKVPTPGLYMHDVKMEGFETGVKVKGTPPNIVLDKVQMDNMKVGIDIDASAPKANQGKK